MWLRIKNVIWANHMISLIISSTTPGIYYTCTKKVIIIIYSMELTQICRTSNIIYIQYKCTKCLDEAFKYGYLIKCTKTCFRNNLHQVQSKTDWKTLYFKSLLGEVSEWLLFNTSSGIFQLYHGENKLIFNEMMIMRSALF